MNYKSLYNDKQPEYRLFVVCIINHSPFTVNR
jgi:hypothetical protein